MRKALTSLFAAIGLVSVSKGETTPSEIVESFIVEYEKWNDACYERSEDPEGDSHENSKLDVESYEDLLSRYCLPEIEHLPIAFGWTKDPKIEKVFSEEIKGKKAIVITHETYLESITEFEYRFILHNGRWFLEAKDVIIEGRKIPCL